MRSASSGLTATLLMFVPLLAVPFLAAFGVSLPTTETVAGAAGDPLDESLVIDAVEMDVAHSARHSPDDLFAPFEGADPVVPPAALPPAEPSSAAAAPAVNNLHNASLTVDRPASAAGSSSWENPFAGYAAFDGPHGSAPQADDMPAQPATPPQPGRPTSASMATADAPSPRNPFDFAETASPRVDETAFQPRGSEQPFESESSAADFFATNDPPARTAAAEFDPKRTLFGGDDSANTPARPAPGANQPTHPTPQAQPASRASAAEIATWSAARRRLEELGIDEFGFDPGEDDQRYFFRCAAAAPGNPRVRRQFEAEGASSLDAVRRVIAQVEAWRAGQ
jgi:hypothetical protein